MIILFKIGLILSIAVFELGKAEENCYCDDDEENPDCHFWKIGIPKLVPTRVARQNGFCDRDGLIAKIEIREHVDAPRVLIAVCMILNTATTLWTYHVLEFQTKTPGDSSGWAAPGEFYPHISAEKSYTDHKSSFLKLLCHQSTEEYLPPGQEIQRGHLTPCADFPTLASRDATYFHMNAVPMWKSVNTLNWKKMEQKVRDLAKNRNLVLDIWTGTYNVLHLEKRSQNNKLVAMYLGKRRESKPEDPPIESLPIPHYIWKVIYNRKDQGVAIVTVNNPYFNPIEGNICPDYGCHELGWLNWNNNDPRRGYTICCTIDDFLWRLPLPPPVPANLDMLV